MALHGFFLVFFVVFEIGFHPSPFVVFIKPYFENHEKTIKKPSSSARKPPKNYQKTIMKSTSFQIMDMRIIERNFGG